MLPLFLRQNINNMNKGTHFIGQPMYGQLLNLLDKQKILRFSSQTGTSWHQPHAASLDAVRCECVNCYTFRNRRKTGRRCLRIGNYYLPSQLCLIRRGLTFSKNNPQHLFIGIADRYLMRVCVLADSNNSFIRSRSC